jgi:DNA-binding transcriptional LysR family regulator
MDELGRIRTFIDVVDAGSFSRAARGSSISAITRRVQSLEAELGVRLLNRTTRGLSLTDVGRGFYDRVRSVAIDFDTAISEVRSQRQDVKGVLRISLRPAVASTIFVRALPELFERYPDLKLDIRVTDEKHDLLANNIDVAVWLGHLPDSVIARRLSTNRRIVCGSPAYFRRHGVPKSPQDLRDHNCMLFTPTFASSWRFGADGVQEEVEVGGNLCSDNAPFLLNSALNDNGVVVVFEWMVHDFIAEGRLTRVLSNYSVNPHAEPAELFAVWPSGRGMSKKARVFVDFLGELFAVGAPA